MTKKRPIPQVQVKIANPNTHIKEWKEAGGRGYVMTKTQHLWLHATKAEVERFFEGKRYNIIKVIGQPA